MVRNKRHRDSADEMLEAKEVVQTRFPDVSLLDQMGLSTVTQVFRDDNMQLVCKIKWTAYGRSYSLTRLQIAEAWGIEDGGNEDDKVTKEVVLEWWRQGSGELFFPKNTSDMGLSFPPWWIIHKVLAMCFLNRAENSKISLNQLYYMYAFSAECSSYVPDWIAIFFDACREAYTTKAGDIAIGGMISLLAERAGCVPKGTPLPGNSLYDLEWCTHHSWIRDTGGRMRYKYGRVFIIDIPRAEPIQLGTWEEMYIPLDVIPPGRNIPLPAPPQVPAPGRQQRRATAASAS